MSDTCPFCKSEIIPEEMAASVRHPMGRVFHGSCYSEVERGNLWTALGLPSPEFVEAAQNGNWKKTSKPPR